MKIKLIFSLFILILFSNIAKNQTVGVVLSGGGAKGMAHIGVLRVLEENNIPIDYIVGTSIGAMVGGLYASGYSLDEIEALFSSEDFKIWSSGEIEDKYSLYYKKEDDNAEMTAVRFRADSITKTYLPANIIQPHQMDFAFMQILAGPAAAANYNFDSLFIPFRCAASDVYAHEAVYFSNGDLSSSIRASMTFPLYFKPIKINCRLMFDGGIYDNFPKKILIKDFNPDYIIGVKVSSNSEMPEDDDILVQLENMITTQTDFNIDKSKGILIEPKVGDISLMDFDKTSDIAKIGYNTALQSIDEIKQKVHRQMSISERQNKRVEFTKRIPKLLFNNINFKGLKPIQTKYVSKLFTRKNEIIGIEKLKEEYFKIIADEHIESIYPHAKYLKDIGLFDLDLDIKKEKKFKASLGGNVSSSSLSQGYLGITYKYLVRRAYKLNANVYFGKFYNSALVKGRVDFATNIPWYLETGFCFNRFNYSANNPEYFYEDKIQPYVVENDLSSRTEAGFPVKSNGKLIFGYVQAGLTENYYQTKYFTSSDKSDKSIFNFSRFYTFYEENSLNHSLFPDRGIHFLMKAEYNVGSENFKPGTTTLQKISETKNYEFYSISLNYTNFFRFSHTFSVGYNFNTEWSSKSFFNNYTSSLSQASAYKPYIYTKTIFNENYRANSFAAIGPMFIFRLFTDLQFRLEGFVFQPYQDIFPTTNELGLITPNYGKAWNNRYFMGTTALVYHSFVGPISLSYNYFQLNEKNSFYLVFNLGFLIFNKSSRD